MCDNDLGQPIALSISDQETTEAVELFLQSIKNRSPLSAVSILMTDDGKIILLQFQFTHNSSIFISIADNTAWNAATRVFGPPFR